MIKRVFYTFTIATLLLLICNSLFAQRSRYSRYNPASNTIYIEIFGSTGGIYSLGYDKVIKLKANNKLALGTGVEYLHGMTTQYMDILRFSPQLSYLYGNIHHFEAGFAVSIDVLNNDMKLPFRIGYRYQQDEGNFFFRASVNPMVSEGSFEPYGGVSVGWTL